MTIEESPSTGTVTPSKAGLGNSRSGPDANDSQQPTGDASAFASGSTALDLHLSAMAVVSTRRGWDACNGLIAQLLQHDCNRERVIAGIWSASAAALNVVADPAHPLLV
ncbi:hypothetical protein ColLi_12692 [Colletotrichum liriopes]|uniref:Uncharacterized protein n=1 Tax=Colletotrichum liriopes TaxID=708192 RepID=A0AA37GZQ8_9PEZI|nr:hypothetical protein ColLi_12692 [Colletotrichum liriopes]